MKTRFLVLMLLVLSVSYGQDNVCMKTVLSYNKKMANVGKPEKEKVYHFEYKQEMSYWDSDIKPVKTHVNYYIGEKQMHVLSDDMNVYTDENFIYTVILKEKKIIVTRNVNESADQSISNFFKNQEAIIKKCSVKSCTDDKSKGLKKVVLDATSVDVEGIEISELTYFMKLKGGDMKKGIIKYSKNYPIRRMALEIIKSDFNSSYRFPNNLKDQFFDTEGKLIGKYKEYQLIN